MTSKGRKGKDPADKPRLDQEQIDDIARRIGYEILENAIQFGKVVSDSGGEKASGICVLRYNCERGGNDFKCDPYTHAFQCTGDEFKCGAHGKTFECKGGDYFDFECIKSFDCGSGGGEFKCLVSYDDEDCEKTVNCAEDKFNCDSSKEYNT